MRGVAEEEREAAALLGQAANVADVADALLLATAQAAAQMHDAVGADFRPLTARGIAHPVKRLSGQHPARRLGWCSCARVPDRPAKVQLQSLVARVHGQDDRAERRLAAEAWMRALLGEQRDVADRGELSGRHEPSTLSDRASGCKAQKSTTPVRSTASSHGRKSANLTTGASLLGQRAAQPSRRASSGRCSVEADRAAHLRRVPAIVPVSLRTDCDHTPRHDASRSERPMPERSSCSGICIAVADGLVSCRRRTC
jgi:hypothetical protein